MKTFEYLNKNVSNKREKIAELQKEKQVLQTALLSKQEVMHNIDSFVGTNFDSFLGDINLSNITNPDGRPGDFNLNVFGPLVGQSINGVLSGSSKIDLAPALCFLMGDQIKEKLKGLVGEMSVGFGPSMSEREKLIDEIDAKIYKLEIEEEKIIMEADTQGFEIFRREDCDPKVVLETF